MVSGDVAQTRNSHAAFCSRIGDSPLMERPVPPHMLVLFTGPRGSRAYPTLPRMADSGASSPAANSCQFGAIATCSALNASSSAFQSQAVLPGWAMPRSFL